MENIIRGNTPSMAGAGNSADGVLGKASSGAHAAVDSITVSADDAMRKAQPAIHQVAAMAHQAVDKVAGVAAPTADWLAEQGESLNATKKKMMNDACSYVSAHPFKSVGVAVLAGFLISRMMR